VELPWDDVTRWADYEAQERGDASASHDARLRRESDCEQGGVAPVSGETLIQVGRLLGVLD
jgi:hypothetical protein